MHDQANMARRENRPKPSIFRLFELVELETRMRRVQLEVERCGLHELLLFPAEAGKVVRERVGKCGTPFTGFPASS